ncbi:hypothetical protein [Methylobacterium sp. P1-11]|uniref:hypothetical protein n=1 Tax=Methylobacterium sp. P1-11 TaxID=2024616 RepID=UPI001FEFC988|nr:hypothetical protein [Methylobacterium sp. P1-11]
MPRFAQLDAEMQAANAPEAADAAGQGRSGARHDQPGIPLGGGGALPCAGLEREPAGRRGLEGAGRPAGRRGGRHLPALREKFGFTSEAAVIGGVKSNVIQPRQMPEANRNRSLLHIRGGGYVYNPGESGTLEAIVTAGLGGYS